MYALTISSLSSFAKPLYLYRPIAHRGTERGARAVVCYGQKAPRASGCFHEACGEAWWRRRVEPERPGPERPNGCACVPRRVGGCDAAAAMSTEKRWRFIETRETRVLGHGVEAGRARVHRRRCRWRRATASKKQRAQGFAGEPAVRRCARCAAIALN